MAETGESHVRVEVMSGRAAMKKRLKPHVPARPFFYRNVEESAECLFEKKPSNP
jgi:hypothetical protein